MNDPIVEGLNITAQMLSHLSGQYRVFRINLHKMGMKWLSKKIFKLYHGTEEHLDCTLKRIFYYRIDPEYEIGSVKGADTVKEILSLCSSLVSATLKHAIEQRKASFAASPDYTTDIYEHIIECLEQQEYFLNQQLDLMRVLGGEPAYIASRLED